MTLSTVDTVGQTFGRIVLLKESDERGFTFFTNYESRKGRELEGNPTRCVGFFLAGTGTAGVHHRDLIRVSRESRGNISTAAPKAAGWPPGSPARVRSLLIATVLEKKLEEVMAKYPGEEVPLPPYWGGYCIVPFTIEFWQGRPNRLHDRFIYMRQAGQGWKIERLSPDEEASG